MTDQSPHFLHWTGCGGRPPNPVSWSRRSISAHFLITLLMFMVSLSCI
jgi:hypothetical protein